MPMKDYMLKRDLRDLEGKRVMWLPQSNSSRNKPTRQRQSKQNGDAPVRQMVLARQVKRHWKSFLPFLCQFRNYIIYCWGPNFAKTYDRFPFGWVWPAKDMWAPLW